MTFGNIPLPLLDLILSHLSIAEVLALAYTSRSSRDVIFQQPRWERYLNCNYPYLNFDSDKLLRDYNRVCRSVRRLVDCIISRRWSKHVPLPWDKISHTLRLTTSVAELGLISFVPYHTFTVEESRCYRYFNLLRPSFAVKTKDSMYIDCPLCIWLSQTREPDDVIIQLTYCSDLCSASKRDDYNVASFRLSEFVDTQEFELYINDMLLQPLNDGYGLLPSQWEELYLSEWLIDTNPLFVVRLM